MPGALTRVVVALPLMREVAAHGYATMPISRQEMSHSHYVNGMPASRRWDPESSEYAGACAAATQPRGSDYTESTAAWDEWYKAAGVPVPHLAPGKEFDFSARLTVDHGGQAWVMVACADHIEEDLPWTILERAPGDRNHHILPSNPAIFAWGFGSVGTIQARYVVPAGFSCPSGRGVGRWVWKNGISCTDSGNHGNHKTETFSMDEWCAIGPNSCGHCCAECLLPTSPGGGGAVETWISCFDFTTEAGALV